MQISGSGKRPMVFAHGFGCDQNMWRFVTPAFEADYKVVLFDYAGHGGSERPTSGARYSILQGYTEDVLEILAELGLKEVVFVGHSVSAVIGALASIAAPERFSNLIMVAPSPCYINQGEYIGGFSRQQIDELLEFLDTNHLGWSSAMAPAIMGNPDRPELTEELTASFCSTDPEVAKQFAKATFLSDNRRDLPLVTTPTLVIQCSYDIIAQQCVGEYVHAAIPNSRYALLSATGHCPHLSDPAETTASIKNYLAQAELRGAN